MSRTNASNEKWQLILSGAILILASVSLWWLSVEITGACHFAGSAALVDRVIIEAGGRLILAVFVLVWWRYVPVAGCLGKLLVVSLAFAVWGLTQPCV